MEIYNTIDCQIKTAYGYNEKSGVFLMVRYELKEDDLDIGVPMEFYTGSNGIGHNTEDGKMKVLMKRFLVPDNELNMLFGTGVTSGVTKPMMTQSTPRTDKRGTASTTTEAVLTDKEKASKLQEIEAHNTIENYRIGIVYGSNKISGVYLKVKYESQEEGSDVGAPMEFYTGNEYAGKGNKIDRETMKVWMKNYKVPDDEVEKLFATETTPDGFKQITPESTSSGIISTESKPVEPPLVETGGAITTAEASLTGNATMPQPDSSGTTIGVGDGGAVTTTEAALAKDTSGSEEDEDKGTTATVQEVKDEKKKTKKNRTKHQKKKAKENRSTDILVDIDRQTPSGDCFCCHLMAEKLCAKCLNNSNQISYYCSKKCWDDHLSVHKQICSLEKPEKKYPNSSVFSVAQFKSVYGIFLPEKTARPRIVDVKIERKWNPTIFQYFYSADSKEFLGETGCPTYITENTRRNYRAVSNHFIIFYRPDKFLTDDSKDNQFVDLVTGGVVADVWIGPILIVKSQGNDQTNFNPIDVDLSDDFIDIIDYFNTQQSL